MTKRREAPTRAPRLEDHLCFALYSASRAFTRAYQPLLEPLGLTYPQYLVMLVLWEGRALSVSELGARLGLDSGTLTPLLKRLEQARLVSRRRDVEDERVVRVSLTEAGAALHARARDIPAQLACRAGLELDGPGVARLAQLRETLRELTERFGAEPEAEA